MMRYNLKWAIYFLALTVTGFWSCVNQDFDEPPVRDLPKLETNATIDQLKAIHPIGAADNQVVEDWIIEATVIADDRSGNFFRQIVVQDETGGITVRLNATGLYNDFPIGSVVQIRMKGLYVSDYNGLYQLNGAPEEAIAELLIDEHVFLIEREMPVIPRVVSLDELQDQGFFSKVTNTLIQLDNVQFISSDAEAPYADADNLFSLNRTIEDCDGNTIIVRSSGYADFARELTPAGNGSIIAVMTVFNDTKQMIIRDPSDATMGEQRCGAGTGTEELISISDLRDLYTGGTAVGPDNKKIRGIVISDKDNGNIVDRNLVLQDGDAGITIRFEATHNFALGEELEVVVSGQELSEFNGLMQVNNVPNSLAKPLGAATQPQARIATVGEVTANAEAWESTLVRLNGVTLSGGAIFDGGITVSDASGSIDMFTRNTASFANQPLPTGPVDLIVIVSQFNSPQVIIRNLSDVIGGGGGGDPEVIGLLDLRNLYNNGASAAPAGKKIRGVVISDKDNGNWTGRNLVIQDQEGGIVVRFNDDHSFTLGEEIEILVAGVELSEYNGLLQLNNVPNSNASSFGNGQLPEPRLTTFEQIIDNAEAWESTLVKIENVTFTDGGTYSGSKTLDDETATIVAFTRSAASFADNNVPGGAVTLIAVVSDFNGPQVIIRNLNDVMEN